MFRSIIESIPRDKDYPDRAFTIDMFNRVLKGTIYDHLRHPFNCEKNGANEYVPIMERRPSVRCNIAKKVVDDSVSMLFSDAHFPHFDCTDEILRDILLQIKKESHLDLQMIEAATKGSVGSVAIIMRILENRLFFETFCTKNLTPVFDPKDPDNLISVREQYKVSGRDLVELDYDVEEDVDYWFIRDWDSSSEIFYLPKPIKNYRSESKIDDEEFEREIVDKERTVEHNLGFVPIVWIKNLPNGEGIDGECTFAAAIDTIIEIDYQLSQVGRGLRYSSDPTLLIKEPAVGQGQIIKGAGNALIVDAEGDAKYLEIDGGASNAVLEYVKRLRETALESVNGNRTSPDKISVAQSGVAMKHMNQDLVNLVDKLRITYGECGILKLLKMILKATKKYSIVVNGEKIPELDENSEISLRWPDWYPQTILEMQQESITLKTLTESHLISKKTALKILAQKYDIEDIDAELLEIAGDEERSIDLLSKVKQPSAADAAKEEPSDDRRNTIGNRNKTS